MTEKIVSKEDLKKILEGLMKTSELLAPGKEGDLVLFKPVKNPEEVFFAYPNSLKPVKEFFFPPREELFKHEIREGKVGLSSEHQENRKRVIWGVRPCDAKSLLMFDKMFDGEYKDSYYLEKRAKSVLVGLACNEPLDSCFCLSLNAGPHAKEGLDVLITDLGDDSYLVEGITAKGEELFQGCGKESGEGERTRKKELEEAAKKKIRKTCQPPPDLESFFEDPYWEKVSRKCISCGVCTYLCPTCFCFDLSYEGRDCIRFWDSCSFSPFTKMTSGENPRREKKTRYRQRVYHKFSYFKKNFGEIACVGCGRCLRECPVKVDIVEIVNQCSKDKTKD
ncbi:MAG: hypothetical protein GXO98_01360 [Nitrospirae bacterium]|nr:hypothetical protein [Nitrospirota bacterium]